MLSEVIDEPTKPQLSGRHRCRETTQRTAGVPRPWCAFLLCSECHDERDQCGDYERGRGYKRDRGVLASRWTLGWQWNPHGMRVATWRSAGPSLDHLGRLEEQRARDGEADGLGHLEVNDEVELRRLLDRQISGLGTLEDLVHIPGDEPVHVRQPRAIRHQAACLYPPFLAIHRWQAVCGRQGRDS